MNESLSNSAVAAKAAPSIIHMGFKDCEPATLWDSTLVWVWFFLIACVFIFARTLWLGLIRANALEGVARQRRICVVTTILLIAVSLGITADAFREYYFLGAVMSPGPEQDAFRESSVLSKLFEFAFYAIPLIGFGIAASWMLGQVARDRRERGD